MKRAVPIVFSIYVLLIGAGCTNGDTSKLMPQSALAARLDTGNPTLVLDVRTADEFSKGHVPGAVNIPYDSLEKHLASLQAAKQDEIVVYCEQGGRASIAESILREGGFLRVFQLEGNMKKWREEKRPCKGC